jgi:hypothetical protein
MWYETNINCSTLKYNRWGDPGVDGRIFKKWDVGVRTGLGWLRIGIRGLRL